MAELVIKLVNGELAGKTMQSLSKEVNAAAVAFKKAEVGTQAWVDAHAKLEKAKGLQADMKKQIDSTSAASNVLKGVWNQMPGAQYFNQITDSLGMMKGGVGGLTGAFRVLKVAIAATGIGLIVLAVVALMSAFSKFTPIVDKVEHILSGISAVISELIQRIQNFGAGLWKIITGAPGGVEQLSSSFDGLGESMKNAYEAGVELKKLQQDLEDTARGLEIANARAEKQVEKLIVMSKNKSRSDREQIELLQQARKIAEENFSKEEEHHQKSFEALMKEAQLESKLSKDEIMMMVEGTLAQEIEYEKRGNLSDELLDKIKDAMIDRINAEGATGKLLEKIQNQENARLEKQHADREAARKKALDAELKALKEEQDAKNSIRKLENEKRLALIEDEKAKEIEALNISTEEKIIALQGSEAQILEQITLLRDIQGAELASIDKKWADKKAEEDKKAKDEQEKRDKELAEKQKKLAEDKAQFEQEMADVYRDVALDSFGFATEMSAKLLKDEASAKKVRKAGAILEIGINLQREMAANAANAAANPLNATTFGAAGAAQLTATNLRSIIRAAISTAKVIAFRKGGVLRGPSHENNGIPFTVNGRPGFEAEGDEILLTKGVYRNPTLRRAASALNVLGGGRKFAAGGPVDPFQDRAPVSRGQASGSDAASILDPALGNKMDIMISLLDAWPRQLKVINIVTETEEGIRTVNQIREDASV